MSSFSSGSDTSPKLLNHTALKHESSTCITISSNSDVKNPNQPTAMVLSQVVLNREHMKCLPMKKTAFENIFYVGLSNA